VQEEVKHIQSVPLVIEPIDHLTGIVGSTTGSNYVAYILSTLDRELLKPSFSASELQHLRRDGHSEAQYPRGGLNPFGLYKNIGINILSALWWVFQCPGAPE
jgi:hypothetical protein